MKEYERFNYFVCGTPTNGLGFQYKVLGQSRLPGDPKTYLDRCSGDISTIRVYFCREPLTVDGILYDKYTQYRFINPNDEEVNRGAYIAVGCVVAGFVSLTEFVQITSSISEVHGNLRAYMDVSNESFQEGFSLLNFDYSGSLSENVIDAGLIPSEREYCAMPPYGAGKLDVKIMQCNQPADNRNILNEDRSIYGDFQSTKTLEEENNSSIHLKSTKVSHHNRNTWKEEYLNQIVDDQDKRIKELEEMLEIPTARNRRTPIIKIRMDENKNNQNNKKFLNTAHNPRKATNKSRKENKKIINEKHILIIAVILIVFFSFTFTFSIYRSDRKDELYDQDISVDQDGEISRFSDKSNNKNTAQDSGSDSDSVRKEREELLMEGGGH